MSHIPYASPTSMLLLHTLCLILIRMLSSIYFQCNCEEYFTSITLTNKIVSLSVLGRHLFLEQDLLPIENPAQRWPLRCEVGHLCYKSFDLSGKETNKNPKDPSTEHFWGL